MGPGDPKKLCMGGAWSVSGVLELLCIYDTSLSGYTVKKGVLINTPIFGSNLRGVGLPHGGVMCTLRVPEGCKITLNTYNALWCIG